MSTEGTGFCQKCDWFCTLQLTGNKHSDGAGGLWWECAPDQVCPSCGIILEWLHEPVKEELLFSLPSVMVSKDIEQEEGDKE